jgi:hypothetical protein
MISASSFGRDHIGPVARRQVDPGDVAHLLEAGEPGVALVQRLLVLLGRVSGVDEGARDVEPRLVRQLDCFAQDTARLRDRPLPEGLELLLAESVENVSL